MKSRDVKRRAYEALEHSGCDYRKIFFLYGAVSLGLSLLVTAVDAALAGMINEAGGLAGLQTRAILSTAQLVLQIINLVAVPVLQFGMVYCSLRLFREGRAVPADLLEGFRRFGPVLGLLFMTFLIWMGLWFACCYAAVMIFIFTPMSGSFMELMTSAMDLTDMTAADNLLADEAFLQQLLSSMTGYFVILAVVLCAVGIPLLLRMSMSNFVVMDREKKGGMQAIRESFRITKGNGLQLLGLGLRFWWFYVLSGLSIGLMYLDAVVPLPGESGYWIGYALYLIAQMALFTLAAPRVQTAYAAAYETMKKEKQPQVELPQMES